jgi:hypothetical protein
MCLTGERLADEQGSRGEQRRGDECAAGMGREETRKHGQPTGGGGRREICAGPPQRVEGEKSHHGFREMIFQIRGLASPTFCLDDDDFDCLRPALIQITIPATCSCRSTRKDIRLRRHLVAHPNVPIWRSRLQMYGITSVILDEKYLSLASMGIVFETVYIWGRLTFQKEIT